MIELPDDPIAHELEAGARRVRRRHLIHRLIYIAVVVQGIRWLYIGVTDILFVYPKIATYYQSAGSDQSAYMKLIGQAVLISLTSFLETAVGLAMLVKKSHTIENIHMAIGIIIFLLSFYFKHTGISLDPEVLKDLSLIPSLIPSLLKSAFSG